MFGLPYIIAPQEAEAQCAWLDAAGLVDGVVTDDNDVFLFGARRVYRWAAQLGSAAQLRQQAEAGAVPTESTAALSPLALPCRLTCPRHIFESKRYVEEYRSSDVEAQLGLGRDKLAALAQLLGGDYCEGVQGGLGGQGWVGWTPPVWCGVGRGLHTRKTVGLPVTARPLPARPCSIAGVGIVNAMEIVHAFPGPDGLRRFREWVMAPDEALVELARSTGGGGGGKQTKKRGGGRGRRGQAGGGGDGPGQEGERAGSQASPGAGAGRGLAAAGRGAGGGG